MSKEELKSALDFSVGDIVQIKEGRDAGRVCAIIGIQVLPDKNGELQPIYALKLSDKESRTARGSGIRFVRHGDD